MSLDNTRYIYDTITYQEKRMVGLVKHNYIKRLKHRYITLGTKGKEYLLEAIYFLYCSNKYYKFSLEKDVYPIIAKEYGDTPNKIIRAVLKNIKK